VKRKTLNSRVAVKARRGREKGKTELITQDPRHIFVNTTVRGFATVLAIACAMNGVAGAEAAPDALTLMKAAATLDAAGRYQDAAILYGRAGKLYDAGGDHTDAATAQTDSANMYEKWANQLMKTPAGTAPAGAAPVQQVYPPARSPAPPAQSRPAPTVGSSYVPQAEAERPIHFAPMAATPGYVTGRAVFENGTPVPDFQVHVAGMSGKLDPYFNNHLSGPQLTEGATTFGDAKGHNGSYSVHMTEDALVFCVTAISTFHFHGKIFSLDMWPTDNLGNTTSPGDFRGQVSKGIVRNFVLKSTGLRPDHAAAQFPDHSQAANSTDANAYYGGTVDLSGDVGSTDVDWFGFKTSIRTLYPNGSKITMTFTPTGPLVDGMPAHTLVRSTTLGSGCFCYYGIPYGTYNLTGQISGANGASRPLKMAPQFILNAAGYHSTLPVEWTPFPDGVGLIITPVELWAAPQ